MVMVRFSGLTQMNFAISESSSGYYETKLHNWLIVNVAMIATLPARACLENSALTILKGRDRKH